VPRGVWCGVRCAVCQGYFLTYKGLVENTVRLLPTTAISDPSLEIQLLQPIIIDCISTPTPRLVIKCNRTR